MFKKILVANRGEIAVRVIRAIHELGATAVAVYSDADRIALHVQCADEAYRIGPPPAAQSYLNIEAIIAAAKEAGVDAAHPGYGFLAENAAFAQAVVDAGITWIGPPAHVIELMGDKVAAKRTMATSGVPTVPGYLGEDQSVDTMRREAANVGYPVMLKAAAGGGGRGMRIVSSPDGLAEALEGAKREARAAFGDDTVFIEKLLVAPRHIEIQVLADTQGNTIYLGERECSIQRRHQKVVEEAPSPIMTPELRAAMGEAAVRAAQAVNYVNAGTVEFLVTPDDVGGYRYYFLEMNTRIQVEHPVTEMVTGVDLVKKQIEIAAGQPLDMTQADVSITGHAIECRLYAEDPDNGFLPQSGNLTRFEVLEGADNVRNDVGTYAGADVSPYYDPLLAKIVAYGADRAAALRKMQEALEHTRAEGIVTNVAFLRWIIGTPAFEHGDTNIAFIDTYWNPGVERTGEVPSHVVLGVAAFALNRKVSEADADFFAPWNASGLYPWSVLPGWRLTEQDVRLAYVIEGERFHICGVLEAGGTWSIQGDGWRESGVAFEAIDDRSVLVRVGPRIHVFERVGSPTDFLIWSKYVGGGRVFSVTAVALQSELDVAESSQRGSVSRHGTRAEAVVAPMPGSLVKLGVAEGDHVQAHQTLAVMEAMKMEHVLEATHGAVVKKINFAVGDMVPGGATIIELEDA